MRPAQRKIRRRTSHADIQKIYDKLISVHDLSKLSAADAIEHVGWLIDAAHMLREKKGLQQAVKQGEQLLLRDLAPAEQH